MNTDKTNNPRNNRDFERHRVYAPRYNDYNRDNKFKFRNSLVITPFYETEFNPSGGIKYIKNHDDRVFFADDSIFATTNNIQKMPVLISRGINKQSGKKKLTIEEKYNYEEKYEIYKNIVLYYEENRIDFDILFNKSNVGPNQNLKDITTEFYLSLSVPSMTSGTNISVNENENISGNPEYIIVGDGKKGGLCMTVYPDKNLLAGYKDRTLSFTAPNISQPQKNNINIKIYLENYRVT
jgi:hypothetical protein